MPLRGEFLGFDDDGGGNAAARDECTGDDGLTGAGWGGDEDTSVVG